LTVSHTEMSQLALTRGELYRTLSMIYIHPPNRSLVQRLLDERHLFSAAFPGRGSPLPGKLAEGLEAIRRFAEEVDTHRVERLADALLVEYTRLLRGVKHGYGPPPPYESVYRGEDVVFGETTMAVCREYQELDFKLSERYSREPPDHISCELDFMRFMCNKELEAWRNVNKNQAFRLLDAEKHFLEEHLMRWVTRFCENVRAHERLGFYRGWADLTEGWLSLDYQLIEYCRLAASLDEGATRLL